MPSQLAAKVRAKYPGAYDDLDDASLEKAVLAKHPEYQDLATPEKSLGGFAGNVVSSAGKFVGDAVSGVGSLAKGLARGAEAYLLDPSKLPGVGEDIISIAKTAPGAIASNLKQRYGGLEQIKNTAYEDPVGMLSDVSTVLGGAGAAMKLGGAGKLSRIASAASDITNPVKMAGSVIEPVLSGGASKIVQATVRPPAAVKAKFGGAKGVADAILNQGVASQAGAEGKLAKSVAKADQLIADAEAAGVPGVKRIDVARSVLDEPKSTAKLRTRLGAPDETPDLEETAKRIFRNNPERIPLTQAQTLKREAQDLAYEAGRNNQSVTKAAQQATARALKAGIEQQVPEVAPVNAASRELLAAKQAFKAAENRPHALTNMLSILGGVGGAATAGPIGLAAPLLIKGLDSPRMGALAGILLDRLGKASNVDEVTKAALLARLAGAQE